MESATMKATRHPTASRRAVLAGLAAAPVAALPGLAEASACPASNPELAELFEAFEAAWPEYLAEFERNELDDTPCWNRLCEIEERINATPALSLADVLMKLRFYGHWHMNDLPLSEDSVALWEMRDGNRDGDERALIAIARDIHRLAGAPAV